jgi:WD40 repeat protein/tetratricopeptide (TPR) repeat protein
MNIAAPLRSRTNPFPGLRPFREDEEHLFFGRESQVDAMVDTLAATRFLAVVGTSGSGKSSLVNCGLRPALHRGLMSRAGTAWRMAYFRPGHDPLGALASALARDGVLFQGSDLRGDLSLTEMIRATLDMSKLGLIDIYEQARLGEHANLLVIADQFEELFRYRHLRAAHDELADAVPADATAFANLLLEARDEPRYPIYVVLTMRSDFLGDCVQFPGLPEAINAGQYLVPRLTRDERRAAISGPVSVGGATISPVLLTRLVNDVGDNPDQLSILQHALNRTWARWQEEGGKGSLELAHYEAIGTMAHALDQHAEAAYAELSTARQQLICRKLFKALTDRATDPRGVRRPTPHGTLCALAEAAAPEEVREVVDVFREPSRSFLMPPAGEQLNPDTVVDISHESLMRVWERLRKWAEEEAQSARLYRRLAETAMLHEDGRVGLSRDPELQLALEWRQKEQPTSAWAERYHEGFEQTMGFLDASAARRDEEAREQETQRKRELEQAQALAKEQRQRAETQARFTKVLAIGSFTLLLFFILACVGVWRFWVAEKQALEAKRESIQFASQFFGAEALSYLNDELDLALLLGKTASESDERAKFEGRRAILTALESGPGIAAFLFGHTDDVQSVAFSPDGTLMASGSRDHTIRFWDIAGRAPAREPLVGYSDQPVLSVALSPDSKTLASSGEDEILLWDVATGRPRGKPLSYEGQITGARSLAFSPDGRTLASTTGNNIILWEIATGQPVGEPLPLPTGVGKVAFSPDGKFAAAYNSKDKKIYLWDLETGKLHDHQPLAGLDKGTIRALVFSPDGRTIAAGIAQDADPTGGVQGRTRFSGNPQKTILLWDLDTGQPLERPFSSDEGGVSELAFSPNGEILAAVTVAGTIQLWDAATGHSRGQPLSSHRRDKVRSLAFSPDGKVLVTGCDDGAIILWDISGVPALSEPLPFDLKGSKVAVSPDGRTLASGSCGRKERSGCIQFEIRLWDISTGQSSGGPLTIPTDNIADLIFSPDGRTLASGSCSNREGSGCRQSEIRLWNVNTGQSVGAPLTGPTDNLADLALSPDGRTLASGSCGKREGFDCAQGEIRLWDVSTGQSSGGPLVIPMMTQVSLAFSPDGHTLAWGSCRKKGERGCAEAEIGLWDLPNQRLLSAPFSSHQSFINSLAFSPDGRTLASASSDVILWDVETREQRGEPLRGLKAVRYLAFSPDSRVLAAAGIGNDSGDVLLWDLSTQRLLSLPLAHPGVSRLSFSSDGKTLISAGDQGTLKWDLDVASWRARACRIANRNLTVQEWRQYFPDQPYRKTCTDRGLDPGLLRKAVELARAGNLEEALARFHDIQKMDPSSDPTAEARFLASGLVERARELARSGDLEGTVGALRQAKDQDPGLALDPETEARRFAFPALLKAGRESAGEGKGAEAIDAFDRAAALNPGFDLNPQRKAAAATLRNKGQQLAREGELESAVRALGAAKTLDPSLAFDPDAEARGRRAEALVAEGRQLAMRGDMERAIGTFRDAKSVNPSLEIDPDAEAHRLRAEALVAQGQRLAKGGQVEEAVRTFVEAKTLDPSLPLDPDAEAHRLGAAVAARGFVAKGLQLADEGKVQAALTAFAEAKKLDPAAITAVALNNLCWKGAVVGQPDAVMESCEAAVSQEPNDGGKRDSRALARALAGNRQGAIEDFKFFIDWVKKEPDFDADYRERLVQERVRWIAELGAGRNPFDDAAVLQELRKE